MPIAMKKKVIDKQFYGKGFNELKLKCFYRNGSNPAIPVTSENVSKTISVENSEILNRPCVGLSMTSECLSSFFALVTEGFPLIALSAETISFVNRLKELLDHNFRILNLNPNSFSAIDESLISNSIKKLFKNVKKLESQDLDRLSKLAFLGHSMFNASLDLLRLHAVVSDSEGSLTKISTEEQFNNLSELFVKSYTERVAELKSKKLSNNGYSNEF